MSKGWQQTVFGIAVAASFLLGYAGVAGALPFDRDQFYGYFLNNRDLYGKRVLQNGIYSKNAEQFIGDIMREYASPSLQQRTGAEFIIHTMLGTTVAERNGGSRVLTGVEIEEWKARVRSADAQGLVNWNQLFTYNFNSFYQDAWNDNAWYNDSGTSAAIVFYNTNGVPIYVLRQECANPILDSDGIPPAAPPPPVWTMEGDSFIDGVDRGTEGNGTGYVTGRKTIYALPGDAVNFFHFMRNLGPDAGSSRTIAWTRYPGQPEGYAPPMPGGYSNPSPVVGLNSGESRLMNWNGFTVPANAQPGQRYCQFVSMFWRASYDQTEGYQRDRQSCAEVIFKYNLIPSVTASEREATQGETVSFGFNVTNDGPTQSRSTAWTVREVVFNAGSPPPGSLARGDNRNCAYYLTRGANSCNTVYNGGSRTFNQGNTSLTSSVPAGVRDLTMNFPPGSLVCRILTVDPPTQASTPRDRWSDAACVLIAKRPTVHFMGGDVSVGNPYQSASPGCGLRSGTGGIYTIANDTDNGSVVEYGAFVRGMIQFQQAARYGFGTASRPATNALLMQRLGFANTTGSTVGNFGGSECMTDYYDTFSSVIAAQASPGSTTLSTTRRVHYNGNVTINASNIQPGARILMVVSGTVTINGDIAYSGNYGSVNDIPSVVIVARDDIRVNSGVVQVDGVYTAKGLVNTCFNGPAELTTGVCNQQLSLNGALVTDRLQLRRTFGGADPDTSEPAERFNYTSELFFNNALIDTPGGRVETVEQRDLPPRY